MLSPHTFHLLTTTEPFGANGRHAPAMREHRRMARRRTAESRGIRRRPLAWLRLRTA